MSTVPSGSSAGAACDAPHRLGPPPEGAPPTPFADATPAPALHQPPAVATDPRRSAPRRPHPPTEAPARDAHGARCATDPTVAHEPGRPPRRRLPYRSPKTSPTPTPTWPTAHP